MAFLQTSFLNIMLGIAAIVLGLSVIIQIFQELYKYVTSSKGRMYTKALEDFLGPWASELLRPGNMPDMMVRGPFQFRKLRPRGILLPLKKEQLIDGLERSTPPWIQRTLSALNYELKFESDEKQGASPMWRNFLVELGNADKNSPGYWSAYGLTKFLNKWDHSWSPNSKGRTIGMISAPSVFDAKKLMVAFYNEFLPHVDDAAKRFSQLEANYDYAYQRRNVRQTFFIALLFALFCNLPFGEIYKKASRLSPEEATQLAEQTVKLYERQKSIVSFSDSLMSEQIKASEAVAHQILTNKEIMDPGKPKYFIDRSFISDLYKKGFSAILLYLFECLVTALMVSFGAPILNDIASALLNLQKGRTKVKPNGPTEASNG